MVENYVAIPIFKYLDQVLEKLKNNNLIKVIMKASLIDGGLPQYQIAHKPICFGGRCH
jgi:hypothetical protein